MRCMNPTAAPWVLGLALSAGACNKNEQSEQTQAKADASKTASQEQGQTPELKPSEATPTLPVHMQDHFTQAAKARDAIIAGDLTAMREPAKWLAEHEVSDTLPENWKPHVEDMQNAGELALQAETLDAAAIAISHMAQACGECHQALGGPKFTGQSPAGEESSTVADMQRHRWAAERMWEGLIGPSQVAWDAGVAALVDAPLHPEAMGEKALPEEVQALAKQAHEAAKQGQTAQGLEAQATQYAEFLSTCAGCHSALGVQVKPAA